MPLLSSLPSEIVLDEIVRRLRDVEDDVCTSALHYKKLLILQQVVNRCLKLSYGLALLLGQLLRPRLQILLRRPTGYNRRFSRFKLEITEESLNKADDWIRELTAKGV
jgi:hypothetical protein